MLALRKQVAVAHGEVPRRAPDTNAAAAAAFEQVPVAMAVLDAMGGFIGANRAFRRLASCSATELRAMSFLALTHSDDAGRYMEAFGDVAAGRRPSAAFRMQIGRAHV